MPPLGLKSIVAARSSSYPAILAVAQALGTDLCVTDLSGRALLGHPPADQAYQDGIPVQLDQNILGYVSGPAVAANALASLLAHLASRESEGRALAAEVLHLYREVHLIEQLSEQLAALLNPAAVGQSALAQAQRLIPATHGCILVRDREDSALRVVASFGDSPAESPLLTDSSFARSILDRGIAEVVNDCATDARLTGSERGLKAVICAPLRAGQRSVGIIGLANATHGAAYSAGDLKLVNTIALQTAAAIENAFLCEEMVGAVRDREQLAALQNELDTARTIQHLLVPRIFPPFPHRHEFDLHAQMTSARAVGGDFFDFFLVDENRLGIVIGDVSGKGIPAALYMALTRMQVKTTAIQGMSPAECFLEVNRVLVRERVSAMFATAFYGLLDLASGELRYCSAGHNPPFVTRAADGSIDPLTDVGGIPLGLFDGMGYTESSVYLLPGDALFLYTDGVSEAQDIAEDDFSESRITATLAANRHLGCRDLIAEMARRVALFTHGAPQSDDITMLSVRRL